MISVFHPQVMPEEEVDQRVILTVDHQFALSPAHAEFLAWQRARKGARTDKEAQVEGKRAYLLLLRTVDRPGTHHEPGITVSGPQVRAPEKGPRMLYEEGKLTRLTLTLKPLVDVVELLLKALESL